MSEGWVGPQLAPIPAGLSRSVPFVGPETLERRRSWRFEARLGANESLFGPAPAAVAAMARAAGEAWMYGDPECFALKAALSERLGVGPEHLSVGEGIDGLLGTLVRLMVSEGRAVVTSDGGYPTFAYHARGCGGRLVTVPYREDRQDLEALAAAAETSRAALVYLSNPDNPMGGWHDAAAVAAFLARLPKGTLLCLDEAYAEFAEAPLLPLLPLDPRVIRMRTFSKAHGMAGCRVGYAIGHPDLIGAFETLRNHFGVNRIGQAGALAALGAESWVPGVVEEVRAGRARIGAIAQRHGLQPLPSATNFVTIDCGRDGAFAREVLAALGAAGVFARMPMVAPLDRCIRITVGPEAALARFGAALGPALEAAGAA